MSDFFGYPVMITEADVKNNADIDLSAEYGSSGARRILNEAHFAVYDGGIYATGDRNIKDKLIAAHEDTALAIKRALVFQVMYLNDIGSVQTESGIASTADGNKTVVTKQELQSKSLCIAAVNALKACTTPIVYAGE